MAFDKAVDSAQLDADLTSIANAIRTKGGTSASLSFPAGFVSAINAISGGGASLDDFIDGSIAGAVTFSGASVREGALMRCTGITSFSGNSVSAVNASAFRYCSGITSLSLQALTTVSGTYAFANMTGLLSVNMPLLTSSGNSLFEGCSSLLSVYLPSFTSAPGAMFSTCSALKTVVLPKAGGAGNNAFYNCGNLEAVDIGGPNITPSNNGISGTFSNGGVYLNKLETLILRYPSIIKLSGTNYFDRTPFRNGGAGGTIYIPKSLYDHLGDNSSSDYKAASNWSTVNGYGTITWAKIEDSYYETHYADGTLIPT